MFTQHPKHSEFFDTETFIDENMSILRDLFDKAAVVMDELNDVPRSSDEWADHAAVFVAAAVYADANEIAVPMRYEEEDEEGVIDLATNLVVLMTLFKLEDEGLIDRKGQMFSLTKEGAAIGKRLSEGANDAA